jgi:hypothetical protein
MFHLWEESSVDERGTIELLPMPARQYGKWRGETELHLNQKGSGEGAHRNKEKVR